MGLPCTVIGVGADVDDEVAGLDGRGGALGGAAQVGADAGQQFLNAEGLGDVVVGAGVERFDLGCARARGPRGRGRAWTPRERMARQTSTPLRPGIMRSVMTRSGGQSRKRRRPSSGSLAVRTS